MNLKLDKVLVHVCPDLELSASNDDMDLPIPVLPLVDEAAVNTCLDFISDRQNAALLVS